MVEQAVLSVEQCDGGKPFWECATEQTRFVAFLNNITYGIGELSSDPERRDTRNGERLGFLIRCNAPETPDEPYDPDNPPTTEIPIILDMPPTSKLSMWCEQYLRTGDEVLVYGSLWGITINEDGTTDSSDCGVHAEIVRPIGEPKLLEDKVKRDSMRHACEHKGTRKERR